MKYWLLYLFCVLSFAVFSQNMLSRQEACADIDYYFATIDSIHPNMYWHAPKEKIDSFKIALKSVCHDSMSVEELGVGLQQSAHFFDYHTRCFCGYGYYEQKCDYAFPRIEIRENKFYLKGKNVEILSVNGISIEEIHRVLRNTYAVDRHPAYILFDINNSLAFQRILMYMDIYPPYEIVIQDIAESDTIIECGVNYWDLKSEEQDFWDKFEDYERPYSFECCPDSSLAIIRYNECVMGEDEMLRFNEFLKGCFEKMEVLHINNLFIDVSRNYGGSTQTSKLFIPFIQNKKEKVLYTLNRRKEWDKRGNCKIENFCTVTKLPKQSEGFDGKIFIYQGPYTCSAGPWLGLLLRTLDLAVLVGTDTEPVLSNYSYGEYFKLSHSKLRCMVSTHFYEKRRPKGHLTLQKGLLPDIPYPFLGHRRLGFSDCMKIIELGKKL